MQEQRVNDHRARLKSAELLSATGALVLGVGLGAALSTYIGSVAVLLLVAGIASHGFGMLQKHRLEAKQGTRRRDGKRRSTGAAGSHWQGFCC